MKISVVSYLNTKPFLWGLHKSKLIHEISLTEDIPSICAAKLLSGEVDIGLVPVVVVPMMKEHYILSDYCIGADGPVSTVMLFSNSPLEKINKIILDYQSKTSVRLLKILAEHFWKISPEWLDSKENYESEISGETAGLVIGDRTFGLQNNFQFQYDLAAEWKKFTGLPFVFACWVSREKLSPEFTSEFNSALKNGIESIPELCSTLPNPDFSKHYLENHISYSFDQRKKKAMTYFLEFESFIPDFTDSNPPL